MTPEELLAQSQIEGTKTTNTVSTMPGTTGSEIANPPVQTDLSGTFEQPKFSNSGGVVSNVSQEIVDRQKSFDEAQKSADEQQASFEALGYGSSVDTRQQLLQQYGVTDESLSELKDKNLQLADMTTASEGREKYIARGAGQTLGQGQREVSQEKGELENAIYMSGLAARAAVLQGNIDTARALVGDMMKDVNADRMVKLNISEKQLDRAYDVADDKEKQLIDQRKQEIADEKEAIQRVNDAVDSAIISGAATQQEIAQFGDANISDEDKLALAQSIVARQATQDRALETEEQRASIRASNALTNERYYNSLVTRAEAGDSEALEELGVATESVDNIGIYGELSNSAGGKPLPSGAIVSLEKAITVASQLNTLGGLFQDDKQLRGLTDPDTGESLGVDLAPITKAFRSNNPFDVKAQQITASINAIIPNLARG